jgi:hypothetical protein
MTKKLFLYELYKRKPVAYIDWEGKLIKIQKNLPKILFCDVPVMLHLTCDIMLSPFYYSNEATGPPGSFKL